MRMHAIIALAATAVLAGGAGALADTIRVPGDRPTIQEAVDAAQTGDTIKIGKGTFREDVTVTKKQKLRILGSGKKTVVSDSWVAFRVVDSPGFTLQNLVIDHADEAAVWITSCQDVTIRRCVVRNVTWHGIITESCERVLVDRCVVDNVGDDGVSLSGAELGGSTNDSVVKKCRITRCGSDGIDVRGEGNLVQSCYVRDAEDDGVQTRDIGRDCDTRVIKVSVLNTGDEGYEIDGQGTVLEKCSSRDASSDAFDVETDDSQLIRCTAKKADDDSFDVEGTRTRMERCKSILPQHSGFLIAGPENEMEKCKSVKAGDDGFHLNFEAVGSTLRRNTAKKSGGYDLHDATPPGSCTLDRNTFPRTNR